MTIGSGGVVSERRLELSHGFDGSSARALVADVWAMSPPTPLEANYPMFIANTSGSTGKPKGLVHAVGGFVCGVLETMDAIFGVRHQSDSESAEAVLRGAGKATEPAAPRSERSHVDSASADCTPATRARGQAQAQGGGQGGTQAQCSSVEYSLRVHHTP